MTRKKQAESNNIFHFIITGFMQIFQLPVTSIFLVFILSFSLFLPITAGVLWNNTGLLANKLNKSAEISIYLKKHVSPRAVTNLVSRLKENNKIAQVEYISPEKGGAEFIKKMGFREILAGLKESPLPATVVVYPKLMSWPFFQLSLFVSEMQQQREVDTVVADMSWIKHCQNLLFLSQHILLVLLILFGCSSAVVMFYTNYTIPWIVLSKQVVTKTTLRYQCLWYGLISSLIVIVIVNFAIMKLQQYDIFLQSLGAKGGAALILISLLFSVFGSGMSIKNIQNDSK